MEVFVLLKYTNILPLLDSFQITQIIQAFNCNNSKFTVINFTGRRLDAENRIVSSGLCYNNSTIRIPNIMTHPNFKLGSRFEHLVHWSFCRYKTASDRAESAGTDWIMVSPHLINAASTTDGLLSEDLHPQ